MAEAFTRGELSRQEVANQLNAALQDPDLWRRGGAAATAAALGLRECVSELARTLLRDENYQEDQRVMPFHGTVAYQILETLRVLGDRSAADAVRGFARKARTGTFEKSMANELLQEWGIDAPE